MSTTTPADLAVWRRLQDAGQATPWPPGVRMLADGEHPAVLDTVRLTVEGLADPDAAARARAMAETAALVRWVVENDDEHVAFGYWRGPDDLPLDDAPVVALDADGQFEMLRGSTLSEALTDEYGQWSHADYTALVTECRAQGVAISADDPDDLVEPEVSPTPAAHLVARYEALRTRR